MHPSTLTRVEPTSSSQSVSRLAGRLRLGSRAAPGGAGDRNRRGEREVWRWRERVEQGAEPESGWVTRQSDERGEERRGEERRGEGKGDGRGEERRSRARKQATKGRGGRGEREQRAGV